MYAAAQAVKLRPHFITLPCKDRLVPGRGGTGGKYEVASALATRDLLARLHIASSTVTHVPFVSVCCMLAVAVGLRHTDANATCTCSPSVYMCGSTPPAGEFEGREPPE